MRRNLLGIGGEECRRNGIYKDRRVKGMVGLMGTG